MGNTNNNTNNNNNNNNNGSTQIDDNNINIGCYNVYFEGYDRKGTIDAIIDMKVDILILQETNKNWERVITNHQI